MRTKNIMHLPVVVASLTSMFMAGCAFQPPSLETGSRFNGTFVVVDASGDPRHIKQVQVAISGTTGVAYMVSADSGVPELDLDLTHCTVLNNGTIDALSWKSSFLDGQEAEVIRCVATSAAYGSRFAIARAERPLDYHPPALARLMPRVKDVHSGDGRILFLWGGVTSAYALAPTSPAAQ